MPSVIGTDSLSGVNVAANYLKTSASTKFGTRELSIIKIAVDVDLFTGSSASGSLYTQAVRALQQTAEVYAVYAPVDSTPDYFCAIIATDTQTTGDTKPDGGLIDTGTGYGILEAAIVAGVTGATTVTITAATLS